MKLILFSPETFIDNEVAYLIQMFNSGLEIFHLRKPGSSIDDLRAYLKKIPVGFRNRIVIHEHDILAKEFDLGGIHWGEKRRKQSGPSTSSGLKSGERISISSSFHDLAELEKCRDSYKYVFYSPVFTSISKENYSPKIELKELGQILKNVQQNVVGLGGITPDNISEVRDLNFYGVGLLGYVWLSSDPIRSFNEIKNAL